MPDPVIAGSWPTATKSSSAPRTSIPLDGHLMLIRLKVAEFDLALLDRRENIDAYDWKDRRSPPRRAQRVRDDMRWVIDTGGGGRTPRARTIRPTATPSSRSGWPRNPRSVSPRRYAELRRVATAKHVDLRRACDVSIRGDFDPVFDLFLEQGLSSFAAEGGTGVPTSTNLPPRGCEITPPSHPPFPSSEGV